MDAEDCEQFTDVYWIKFRIVSNARCGIKFVVSELICM